MLTEINAKIQLKIGSRTQDTWRPSQLEVGLFWSCKHTSTDCIFLYNELLQTDLYTHDTRSRHTRRQLIFIHSFIHSFIAGMHHYECIAPNVDIILQSGWFWATSRRSRNRRYKSTPFSGAVFRRRVFVPYTAGIKISGKHGWEHV